MELGTASITVAESGAREHTICCTVGATVFTCYVLDG